MARVTSKLQVTIPKAIAVRYGIEPGQDVEWLPAGEAIRVVPAAAGDRTVNRTVDRRRRLELFDRATERQRQRERDRPIGDGGPTGTVDRGWRREDLYDRGLPG